MKSIKLFLLAIALASLTAPRLHAQGTTAFTYQGQLHDNGTNANGAYTMIFKLFDAVTIGNPLGTNTSSPTLVNGIFSVNLDFGNVFNGNARWLDITITNDGTTQTLTPRVQVLPAPYAQFAAVAATVTNGAIMNSQLAGNAVNGTNIQNSTITAIQIANGAVTNRNLAANAVNATNIASGQVVKSLNGLTDNVIFSAGNNTALFTNGSTLQLSAGIPNIQLFKASGTFVVPTNVMKIMVEMWGAGGGGGAGNDSGGTIGGGGGAGGYNLDVFTAAPGSSYSVTVPASTSGGQNGGGASFSGGSISISAGGGAAGGSATVSDNGSGGSGGISTGGIVDFTGGSGQCCGGGQGGGVWRGGASQWQGGGGGSGPGSGGGGGSPGASGNGGNSGLVIVYY